MCLRTVSEQAAIKTVLILWHL